MSEQLLHQILNELKTLNQRTENIEKRVENIEKRVENIEHRVENLEKRVVNIEHRVENLETNLHEEIIGVLKTMDIKLQDRNNEILEKLQDRDNEMLALNRRLFWVEGKVEGLVNKNEPTPEKIG